MGTKFPEIFEALAAEFSRDELRSRAGQAGATLWYITARAAQNRLDAVVGPENWNFSLAPWGEAALIGTLTLRLPDGTVVSKSDVGGKAQMKTADDDVKSASSDCFKRCAVQFGISRYLYGEGSVAFARREGVEPAEAPLRPQQAANAPARAQGDASDLPSKAERLVKFCKEKGLMGQASALARRNFQSAVEDLSDEDAMSIFRLVKQMQAPAAVEATAAKAAGPGTKAAVDRPGAGPNGIPRVFKWPHSGAALFAWLKGLEEAFHIGLVKGERGLDAVFVEGKGFDSTVKTWSPAQVEEAAQHFAAIVATCDGYTGQFDDHLPSVSKLRDQVWEAAAALLRAKDQHPNVANIKSQILVTSRHICASHGGEIVEDVAACDNTALMQGLVQALENDKADIDALGN